MLNYDLGNSYWWSIFTLKACNIRKPIFVNTFWETIKIDSEKFLIPSSLFFENDKHKIIARIKLTRYSHLKKASEKIWRICKKV